MSNLEVPENPDIILSKLKNKQRIRLLFPYSENSECKKAGAKFNSDLKFWYYPSLDGTLPEILQKYKANKVDIPFEDKEFFKNTFSSMKYDKLEKSWYMNQVDFDKFLTYYFFLLKKYKKKYFQLLEYENFTFSFNL